MDAELARAAATEGKLEYVENKFAMFTPRAGITCYGYVYYGHAYYGHAYYGAARAIDEEKRSLTTSPKLADYHPSGAAMAIDGAKQLWLFGGKLATAQGKPDTLP